MTPSTGVSLILRIARTFDPGVYTTDRNNGRTAASVAIDRARIDALLAIGQDQSGTPSSSSRVPGVQQKSNRNDEALRWNLSHPCAGTQSLEAGRRFSN
jgi:hypothetical protein